MKAQQRGIDHTQVKCIFFQIENIMNGSFTINALCCSLNICIVPPPLPKTHTHTHAQGELAAAREVFNTFFQYYPYCYGYWKKLADLEKTHAGNDSAKQVSDSPYQFSIHKMCFSP